MSFIVHPSKWEVEHAGGIFKGQAYQATHDGQLPDTPMWRMLEFRHSLNAARFDHWHPNVGLLLEHREAKVESARISQTYNDKWIGYMRGPQWPSQPIAPEQYTNPIPPSDVTGLRAIGKAPSSPAYQAVPEPSAAIQGLTALALTVAIILKRHRLRRLMSPGG